MEQIIIRPARPDELDSIWALVCRAVSDMNARGNPQWGADYPTRDFYAGDIGRGELYAATIADKLCGVACINTSESPEYDPLPWRTQRPAMVIHRMAVEPACQRSGIGASFFRFAEAQARQQGLTAMRIDTYSLNDRMQALIQKMGFQRVGFIHLHGRPLTYPCFEKALV